MTTSKGSKGKFFEYSAARANEISTERNKEIANALVREHKKDNHKCDLTCPFKKSAKK